MGVPNITCLIRAELVQFKSHSYLILDNCIPEISSALLEIDILVVQYSSLVLIEIWIFISPVQKLRGVCSWWIRQNPEQIGGVGIIAEIDEVSTLLVCFFHTWLIQIWNLSTVFDVQAQIQRWAQGCPEMGLRWSMPARSWLSPDSPWSKCSHTDPYH